MESWGNRSYVFLKLFLEEGSSFGEGILTLFISVAAAAELEVVAEVRFLFVSEAICIGFAAFVVGPGIVELTIFARADICPTIRAGI
jgi:hypothetical protein